MVKNVHQGDKAFLTFGLDDSRGGTFLAPSTNRSHLPTPSRATHSGFRCHAAAGSATDHHQKGLVGTSSQTTDPGSGTCPRPPSLASDPSTSTATQGQDPPLLMPQPSTPVVVVPGFHARLHAATSRAVRVMVLPDDDRGAGCGGDAITAATTGEGGIRADSTSAGGSCQPGAVSASSSALDFFDPDQRRMAAVLRMLGHVFPEGRDGGQLAAMRGTGTRAVQQRHK
jgi:hypothetical protein